MRVERLTVLLASESNAVFAPLRDGEGALLYETNGSVEARLVDTRRQLLVGDSRALGVSVARTTGHYAALLGASTGMLANESVGGCVTEILLYETLIGCRAA